MQYRVMFISYGQYKPDAKEILEAQDPKIAFEKFCEMKTNTTHEEIVVDPIGWRGYFMMVERFKNPNFIPVQKEIAPEKHSNINVERTKSSVLETFVTPDFEKFNPTTDSETLKTIMLIQAKQLYWIRIIGIPFLCSSVIAGIYMIVRIFI